MRGTRHCRDLSLGHRCRSRRRWDGRQAGPSLSRIAQLLSWNPAQSYGLHSKGDLAIGFQADVALVDPNCTQVIHVTDSESTQEYTPFEGFTLHAVVTDTFVRGNQVLANGAIVGQANGAYVARGPRN
jgi:allantoinase